MPAVVDCDSDDRWVSGKVFVSDDMKEVPTLRSMGEIETIYEGPLQGENSSSSALFVSLCAGHGIESLPL